MIGNEFELNPILNRLKLFDFQTYFQPALKNIKENLENSGITDQYVSAHCPLETIRLFF